MTTLHINKINVLKTLDNKPMTYISGNIIESNLQLGVQPTSISYIEEAQNYQQGQHILLDDNQAPVSLLNIENKDPWELYGSDHNSGVLWFGNTDKMNEIYKKVEDTYLNHVTTMNLNNLLDEYVHISNSPIVRWIFNDNTSLVIAYVDSQYHQMPTITNIHEKDIISYQFGAGIDDRLAHEFVQPYIARLLKKIKTPGTEIDIEDLGHEDDYPIDVNGKSLTSKNNTLLLKLAEHLYCSILKLHETGNNTSDYEPDEYGEAFAKKLYKNKLINELEKPTSNTDTKMTYIYEGSNKEYTISFKIENNQYSVITSYGSIGKKITTETQISTSDIEEAQNIYCGLLKEKLCKGYDLDSSNSLSLKKNKP